MIHATIDGDTLAPKFDENRYEKSPSSSPSER